MSTAQLINMSDSQLVKFAHEVLGILITKGQSRDDIIKKVVNTALTSVLT